jgi:hypothetical protein
MQAFYAKGGFEIAFRDERYEKIGTAFPQIKQVSEVQIEDLDQLLKLDRACFGFDRSAFTINWIQSNKAQSFKYQDEEGFKGFAVLRKCVTGCKIGPLFAYNQHIASALYEKCLNESIGQPVYLDIPMANPLAIELVKKYDATFVFECARM